MVSADASRDRGGDAGGTPKERVVRTLEILRGDTEYPGEYERFVLSMSNAAEGEVPGFAQAQETLERLTASL